MATTAHLQLTTPASNRTAPKTAERRVSNEEGHRARRPGAAVHRARSRGSGRQAGHRRQAQVRHLRVAADDCRCEQVDRRELEQGPSGHPGRDRPGRRQLGPRQAADELRRRHGGGHHPRRGRRHRRLHPAGVSGEPDAAAPEVPEAVDPEGPLGDDELRRQDHRRPVAAADLQHLREHGHPQVGRDQGADARESVDMGHVPLQREEADDVEPLRRLLGSALADGRDADDVAQLRRPVLLPRRTGSGSSSSAPRTRTSSSRCTT